MVAPGFGELVARDLGERRRRRLHNGQLDPREVQQALKQAAEVDATSPRSRNVSKRSPGPNRAMTDLKMSR